MMEEIEFCNICYRNKGYKSLDNLKLCAICRKAYYKDIYENAKLDKIGFEEVGGVIKFYCPTKKSVSRQLDTFVKVKSFDLGDPMYNHMVYFKSQFETIPTAYFITKDLAEYLMERLKLREISSNIWVEKERFDKVKGELMRNMKLLVAKYVRLTEKYQELDKRKGEENE